MPDDTIVAPPPTIEPKPKTGLGPQPISTNFGDKYRAAFTKAEKTEVAEPPKPSGTEKVEEPPKPGSEPAPEPPKTEKTDEKVVAKPESPLDVVLEKGTKEPEKVEEPDVLKEFDETKPDWKRARGVMKDQSQKIRDYEAKLKAQETAPKADPATATRLQELEAALADRETRLKAAGAEYSPDYQKLVGKYQTTAEKIKTRMQSFGGDGDSLLAALSLPYSKTRTDQIDAALADLDGGKQARVQTLIEELEGHGEEIAEFRKDLPARYEEMTAQQEQAAREQQVQAIKQLETEFVKISETLPESIVTMREVPEDVPGGAEWNKEISEARANALRILKPDGSDFNESAAIAMKGARYDSLEKRYLALHKDYSDLKKRFSDEDAAGADFKGGTKPTVKGKKDFGKSYSQNLAALQRGDMADL